jgi:hypothetical protein
MKRLVNGLGAVALLVLGCGRSDGKAVVAPSEVVVPSALPTEERSAAPAQPASAALPAQAVSSRESQLRAEIVTELRKAQPNLELHRLVIRGDSAVAALGNAFDGGDSVSFVSYRFGPGGFPHNDEPRWHSHRQTYSSTISLWTRIYGLKEVAPSAALDALLEEELASSVGDGVSVTLQEVGAPKPDPTFSLRQLVRATTSSLACEGGQVFLRDYNDKGLLLEFCVKPSGSVSGRARLPHIGTNTLSPTAGPHVGELVDGLSLAPNGELTVSGNYTLTHRPAVASFSGAKPSVTLTLKGSFKLIEPGG